MRCCCYSCFYLILLLLYYFRSVIAVVVVVAASADASQPSSSSYQVLPYLIDEDSLLRSRRQPKFVSRGDLSFVRDLENSLDHVEGERKDEADRRVCRGQLTGERVREQLMGDSQRSVTCSLLLLLVLSTLLFYSVLLRCRSSSVFLTPSSLNRCFYLHHDNPYLRLGPFKMERSLSDPFRMVFQDFLEEDEMRWLLDFSRPRLSSQRCEDMTSDIILQYYALFFYSLKERQSSRISSSARGTGPRRR